MKVDDRIISSAASEVVDMVETYMPPPNPLSAVHPLNVVFVSAVQSMFSLPLPPSETYKAPPFPLEEVQVSNEECTILMDDAPLIET